MRTNMDGGRKALLVIGAIGLVVTAAYFLAGLFVTPLILIYTASVYRVFRGKIVDALPPGVGALRTPPVGH